MRSTSMLCTFLLVACSTPPPVADATAPRAVVERIFEDFNACRVEALVSHYADGGLSFVTPGTPAPLRTRAQLRSYFGYLTERPCTSPASPKHTEIVFESRLLDGAAALVYATTLVRFEQDGQAERLPFHFSFALQRVDGRWWVVSQDAQRLGR